MRCPYRPYAQSARRCAAGRGAPGTAGRSSDSQAYTRSRGFLLAVASQWQWCCASVLVTVFVPAYRCGTVPDSHRVPSRCITVAGDAARYRRHFRVSAANQLRGVLYLPRWHTNQPRDRKSGVRRPATSDPVTNPGHLGGPAFRSTLRNQRSPPPACLTSRVANAKISSKMVHSPLARRTAYGHRVDSQGKRGGAG